MPRLTVLPLAAAAALTLPAAPAQAATSWSSPVQVLAPTSLQADVLGLPEAFVTAQGASLVLGSNADGPQLASGDASGRFAKAVALAGGPALGTTGDLGPDGTFAAGWATNGTARVAVIRPGQQPQVSDLPGAGATTIDVAVGPDGAVTAAWRTKSEGSVYTVSAATAPAGGDFGAPATLTSGRSATDGVEVDVAGDGTIAVVFRKGSPYRTHASVKPAGGAFPAEAQALDANPQADLSPQVAFAADGTAVAAWANPGAGAQVAYRKAGEPAFGAPVALGPAGEPAYTMDLVATPQGGTAATWDGGAPIRAAVQGNGGGFSEAVEVLRRPGSITSQPTISVDPDGVPLVAVAEPQSGEVRAITPGGASQLVGYGKPGQATATDVATVADGRAVVVWQDGQGGLSAATRSAQVAPGGGTGPGPAPAAPDRTAPKLTVTTKAKTLKLRRSAKSISFGITSDEAGKVQVTGTLRTTKGGKRRIAPLTIVPVRTLKAGRQTLTVKLNTLVLKDLRAAWKAKRRGQLLLVVSAKDAGGYETRKRVTFTLAEKR